MMVPDAVNGVFELVGALLIWADVYRLRRDKQVRGVYWPVRAFFMAWGYWNLFYYPSLRQWLSFIGGAAMVFTNTVWVVFAIRYRKH